jgi:uncharacterized protein YdhG (YjbR/CyaY superfamily)
MLETVREAIRGDFPEAEEGIEHGMLAYPGVGFLAAQKHYVSLYLDPEVLDDFRARLPRDCGKSCIRYRRRDQLDLGLLAEILNAVKTQK